MKTKNIKQYNPLAFIKCSVFFNGYKKNKNFRIKRLIWRFPK